MKKLELHLDALILIIVVFALAVAFLIYQRHQYSDLMQENADLVWKNSSLEANVVLMASQMEKCESAIASMEESDAQGGAARSLD